MPLLLWGLVREELLQARAYKAELVGRAGHEVGMTSRTLAEPVEAFGLDVRNPLHQFFLAQGYLWCRSLMGIMEEDLLNLSPISPTMVPSVMFEIVSEIDLADLAEFVPPPALANERWEQQIDQPFPEPQSYRWEELGRISLLGETIKRFAPDLEELTSERIEKRSELVGELFPFDAPEADETCLTALCMTAAAVIAGDQIRTEQPDQGQVFSSIAFTCLVLTVNEPAFPVEARNRIEVVIGLVVLGLASKFVF